MKWSSKIATIAGIGIYIHATFFILIGWIALRHWSTEQSISAVLSGVGFILALFGCVLLHELGHALAAKRYGIPTRDITLLPIGGVARLERMPEEPIQELVVALAGPAVNVVIAAVIWGILALGNAFVPIEELSVTGGPFLERLMVVNIFLVVFNLLPAFPMDGGRVLRALLATRLEYTRATHIAAGIGQAMAFAFGFIGLFSNPFLLFIAFFVWIGAAQEASSVQMKSSLGGIPVYQTMITDFEALSPNDPLSKAVELTLSGSQKDFPVIENGKVVGVLSQRDLMAALRQNDDQTQVQQAMDRDFLEVDSHEMLEIALARLQECQCHTLPVVHGNKPVGLLTMDNIGEFLSFQAAIAGRVPASAGARSAFEGRHPRAFR